MIQRIQTLWLAFVLILSAATFFFPLAMFNFEYKGLEFNEIFSFIPSYDNVIFGDIIKFSPAYSLISMQIGVAIISLISIFLYKNRMLQIKILSAGFLLLAIYIAYLLFVKIDGIETQILELGIKPSIRYGISSYFPILQLLLLILAQRAIKKDDRIVRSSDRLR